MSPDGKGDQMKPFPDVRLLRAVLHEQVDEHRWRVESKGADAARQELAGAVGELVERDPETAKGLIVAAVDLLVERGWL